MISIRKANDRGLTEIDWLHSQHTFSFGNYYDPAQMGFGVLRVINEDRVKPSKGFGTHQHHDMEIISYVISGALSHKDSMGTGSIIKPGEIQRMSAGTGVAHSEFNASSTEPVHFLQIWIQPAKKGLAPSYEQSTLPPNPQNALMLIGSPQGGENAIKIHQNVNLYLGCLAASNNLSHPLKNSGWLQVIKGQITLNNHPLQKGDGAKIENEPLLNINCLTDAEFLLFELENA